MYLTLSSIIFKIAFLPIDDTYGLIKFIADRQNADPEAVGNTLRKLKNFAHGSTLPSMETLDSLSVLLGPNGTVLKEALLNMLKRARRVQMDDGQSRVVVHSPEDKDFEPFFQKELLPFTELDNDFFPPAVAAYVMEVDFGISRYCEAVSRCDGSKANTILQNLALPDDIKDFFRTKGHLRMFAALERRNRDPSCSICCGSLCITSPSVKRMYMKTIVSCQKS